jgi:preprotein translocase subunit SecE
VNRETKRLLQRQGQLGADGTPVATARDPRTTTKPRPAPGADRPSIGSRVGEYFREVRNELVKVAWPPRSEVINYSAVVLVTLICIVLVIFGLNWIFGHIVIWLFSRPS